MSQSFLPPNTKVPSRGGAYMDFSDGDNKFRILSPAITGTEGWALIDGKKSPIRKREDELWSAAEMEMLTQPQYGDKTRYFWAFVVWNYADEEVQILNVRQRNVIKGIEELLHSDDWGDPRQYDLNVKKTGSGKETRYAVLSSPPKAVDTEIIKKYQDQGIDLEKLYEGEDPFGAKPHTEAPTETGTKTTDTSGITPEEVPF